MATTRNLAAELEPSRMQGERLRPSPHAGAGYEVAAGGARYRARVVVVATGGFSL